MNSLLLSYVIALSIYLTNGISLVNAGFLVRFCLAWHPVNGRRLREAVKILALSGFAWVLLSTLGVSVIIYRSGIASLDGVALVRATESLIWAGMLSGITLMMLGMEE